MRTLTALVAVSDATAVVGMGSMILINPTLLGMVVIRAAATLVVSGSHALGSGHGSHALDREGQGEQRDSKNSENPKRHCRGLYASRFECKP